MPVRMRGWGIGQSGLLIVGRSAVLILPNKFLRMAQISAYIGPFNKRWRFSFLREDTVVSPDLVAGISHIDF